MSTPCTSVVQHGGGGVHGVRLPISLYLSPRIPAERSAAFRDLALRQPRYARVVDSEEGALHVLHSFEFEEVAALERARCRVVGLPFAERVLQDPSVLGKVQGLPLYDFIYRSTGAICCSGLPQETRLKCSALARWLGAKFSDELGADAGLLVAGRASLHPESKYQAALKKQLRIVKYSFLEAMWSAKAEVDIEPHLLPPLCGLGICFDPRQADITEKYSGRAVARGAAIEPLERAEVVIVKDTFAPLYQEARKIGVLTASPMWLDRCLQAQCCLPIAGELEVQHPGACPLPVPQASLMASGAGGAGPSAADGVLVKVSGSASGDGECGTGLLGCVLCLLYLPAGVRDTAKALAWRCGACTTLQPSDMAITHVIFKSVPQTTVLVSVPVEEDRVYFLDLAWLETCAREGRRVKEAMYAQQTVHYNPALDESRAGIRNRRLGDSATDSDRPFSAVHRTPASSAARLEQDAAPSPLVPALADAGSATAAAASKVPMHPTMQSGLGPMAPGNQQVHMQPAMQPAVQPAMHPAMQPPMPPAMQPAMQPAVRPAMQPAMQPSMPAQVAGQQGPSHPALRHPPSAEGGVFAGLVLGLIGWPAGDTETGGLVQAISGAGGTAVYGGSGPEAVLDSQVGICVCRDFVAAQHVAHRPPSIALASAQWVRACVADGVRHSQSSFPHFEPCAGPLPLVDMMNVCVRITALHASRESYRERGHLEELVKLVGARVALQSSKWSDITHIVCVVPELLEKKLYESASKRNVKVVSVQWLFECFKMHGRQPEERFSVSSLPGKVLSPPKQPASSGPARDSFSATVLAGHNVLISPSALGSDAKLPQMAEELGATVHTWRSDAELKLLLRARGISPSSDGLVPDAGVLQRSTVVLLDEEEVRDAAGPLVVYITSLKPESHGTFVLPTWLTETYRQRRRLPMDAFRALVATDPEHESPKRQRVDEAMYAWQPAELTRLQELAEDSRAREMQSKVQRKVDEGLRLAELRHEPSRLGGHAR